MATLLVEYQSLEEAVDALVNYANELDDPIDTYLQNANKIGETGSEAWGGTSAQEVVPVLQAIKDDIVELQEASNDFSEKVHTSSESYVATDTQAVVEVENVKG